MEVATRFCSSKWDVRVSLVLLFGRGSGSGKQAAFRLGMQLEDMALSVCRLSCSRIRGRHYFDFCMRASDAMTRQHKSI
jgi:hypothetical protein